MATAGLAGCGDGGGATVVRVFAASSLTEAFTELARDYEADHGDVDVRLTFAASSALATQVRQGADADVFVPADTRILLDLAADGLVDAPGRVVARNRLAIVVEPGNPQGIRALPDLARPGLVVVLCAPEVPCGRLAAAAAADASITLTEASREPNAKAVVAKVALGEADAGIAYATDVAAAGTRADGVPVAAADPARAGVYPMALTSTASDRRAASDFVDFVASARGRRTLARFGFLP